MNRSKVNSYSRGELEEFEFTTLVIHYSKLTDRFNYLNNELRKNRIYPIWITEKDFKSYLWSSIKNKKIFGIPERLVGMDLGVNSRSLVSTRRKARIEGWFLLARSYLARPGNTLSTGSLPNKFKLEEKWLEALSMNITALEIGIKSGKNWILILEDDAVPYEGAFELANRICKSKRGKVWINLNSGAGLEWTKSDPKPDHHGLFRVKPSSTRCSVAVLISRELAQEFLKNIEIFGLPNWLPTDYCFQALLRKTGAKAFWQEPPSFSQGSETGMFKSNLR
jgi:hypothetical protein